jgi:competence protein ComEC
LLAGLVIGDDALMSDEMTDAFARTGTIHVVAVSGSNLALLASILVITQVFVARRVVSEAGGFLLIWGYVLLAGAVPPTLRAGLLATAAAGSRLVGRPADVLTLSLQVAALQAALWPESTLGLSYRLSTIAIFGVVIAAAGRSFDGWLASLRLVAMTTIVVNIAMLPILPAESRPLLLVSLATNIAIAPLIAVSFTLGVLAVASGWLVPPLGEAIAVVAGEINRMTLRIVSEAAGIEHLPGPLGASGSSVPRWFLIVLSIGTLVCVSTEFRRWARGTIRRSGVVTTRTADVATGVALGVLGATIGIILLR